MSKPDNSHHHQPQSVWRRAVKPGQEWEDKVGTSELS